MLRPIPLLAIVLTAITTAGARAPIATEQERFELGRAWIEAFSPPDSPQRQHFPDAARWQAFLDRLQRVLDRGSLADLAALEAPAREMVAALDAIPIFADEAAWVRERLDYMEVARIAPADPAASDNPNASPVPFYDLWLHRVSRPGASAPLGAENWIARLAPAFTEAGLPASLGWLAEIESSFDPAARSPVGAVGLFQLMPDTAAELGLALDPTDERLNPDRNAAAAARYLVYLHRRFGDWALALAAYNAGPTRVAALLRKHNATTFAAIAPRLPAETRMFVPKVLATLHQRAAWSLAHPPGQNP